MSISVHELQKIVSEFLGEYQGNIPLKFKIVNFQEEAYGKKGSPDRVGYLPGSYYPARRRVVLAAASIRDKADAWTTIRHEVLGHYGLNTLRPEDKFELLRKITHTRQEKELS